MRSSPSWLDFEGGTAETMSGPVDKDTTETQLGALRDRIDEIDQELQRLLNARAAAAQEVAHVKMRADPEAEPVFYRPEREAQVLARVKARILGRWATRTSRDSSARSCRCFSRSSSR